jgi:ribose 1,5-bisphosphokinase PhnN
MQIMITKTMSEDESPSNSGQDNLMDVARENSSSGVMDCLLAGRALHRNRVTVKEELIRSDVLNKEFTEKIKWLQDGYEDQSGDSN